MGVSNMKQGACEREKNSGAEVCSYGPFSTLQKTLEKFDRIIAQSQKGDASNTQKEEYIKHMVLMEAFFKPFDTYFSQRQEKFKTNIGGIVGSGRENPILTISFYATRMLLFMMLRFSKDLIQEHTEKTLSSEGCNFFQDFENLSTQYVGNPKNQYNRTGTWQLIYNFLLEKFLRENPKEYLNPESLGEIFSEFLLRALKYDEENNFLVPKQFNNFKFFCDKLDFLLPNENEGSTLLGLLAGYGQSFQILYAMVGSVAQEFEKQEGIENLSEEEKRKMFFSIKRDLLVEARYWSKQFLNDNKNLTESMSMVWFMPDTGTIPTDKFIFDFQKKEISLDANTYPETPIKPEMKTIRRGCPVAFVSGERLGGNFLTRHIDMSLEIFYEAYLNKK